MPSLRDENGLLEQAWKALKRIHDRLGETD